MKEKEKIFLLSDFLNNKVNIDKLSLEIKNSNITNILNYIESDENYCKIYFENNLTENDVIILIDIVHNHDGENIYNKKYIIYENVLDKSLDPYLPPYDIDFTILGLYRIPYVENGELKKVIYYKTMTLINNQKVFTIPVVEKNITYIKNDGYYFSRLTDIYWYFEDGEKDLIFNKNVILYYTNDEAIDAGNKRRDYAVKSVQIEVVGLIQMLHVENSGITSIGTMNNILIDINQEFDTNNIGRFVEIDMNKYLITNVSGNTLILQEDANISDDQEYIIRLSIKQSDIWGTQFLSTLNDSITKYIRGDLDPLKNSIILKNTYNSAITYYYTQTCIINDKTWKCDVSSVSGEWDETKWKLLVDHTWMSYEIPNTAGLTIRDYIYSKLIE